MNLQIDDQDARVLRDLLRQKVTEMDTEINRTDSLTFKEELRQMDRALQRILESLTAGLEGPGSRR